MGGGHVCSVPASLFLIERHQFCSCKVRTPLETQWRRHDGGAMKSGVSAAHAAKTWIALLICTLLCYQACSSLQLVFRCATPKHSSEH